MHKCVLQDARINVHMCLLNCEDAALVAGGSLHNYTAGSLVAFEDRVDHESAHSVLRTQYFRWHVLIAAIPCLRQTL